MIYLFFYDYLFRLNFEEMVVYSLYPILAIYLIATLSTLLFLINLLFIKIPITSPIIIVEIFFESDFKMLNILELDTLLTPGRRNGVYSMLEKIKEYANSYV